MNCMFAAIGAAMVAQTLAAQSLQPLEILPGYEQVILPFETGTLHGQGGSIWASDLWVHNSSTLVVNLFPETCFWLGVGSPCEKKIEIAPNATQSLDLFPGAAAGAFLYIPTGRSGDVHFNLRIRDLTRDAYSAGTEIPIVRARNQQNGITTLLNIPADSRFRLRLRLYQNHYWNSRYTIRIYRQEHLLLEREFGVEYPTDPPHPPWIIDPLDLTNLLSEADLTGAEHLRIEIVPESSPPGFGYWPLLTVTNNETQQVTIITPQ